ncbi:MAG: tetratricopeptide repeat protein [Acidobacteria bacterium]|nr:tetratricopeptide repeat protein [Acidobacteriota bacterium]
MSVSTCISRHPVAVAALLLIASTLLVYAPIIDFQFINYDDNIYVTSNPWVKQGLSWQGARWAMTALEGGAWHPLTWLSHMLDVQLFGLNPSGHHLTNLLLHLANVLLLFGVLQRMTGELWRSALVAALFALHPLNMESVAWVAERKNVLSTLFWLLTIWAYVSYVRKPGWQRSLGVLGVFVLGLMAKPMLVTLPCALLLLDYWPLGRLGKDWREFRKRAPRLVVEKLPLLIPVAAISVVTIKGQSQVGALSSWEWIPLGTRVGNAVLAYGLYLKKMVWPTDLAIFYPHPGNSLAVWPIALAGLLLVILSLGVWWQGQRFRYLVVGWCWYLGTLFPVSGLVQVGGQAMADRYTYIPLMGLFIITVWGGADMMRHRRCRGEWFMVAALCMLMPLTVLSRVQLSYWRNTTALFEHALLVNPNNAVAHDVLGLESMGKMEFTQAQQRFMEAIKISPKYANAYNHLGLVLLEQERFDEAVERFTQTLKLNPDSVDALNNLGLVWLKQGSFREAALLFSQALDVDPDYAPAYGNMGLVLAAQERYEEAMDWYDQGLELAPDSYDHLNNLGLALMATDRLNQAIAHFSRAQKVNPMNVEAYANLGLALAKAGRTEEAALRLSQAIEIQPQFAQSYYYLGLVRNTQERIPEAIENYRAALERRPNHPGARQKLNLLLQEREEGKLH